MSNAAVCNPARHRSPRPRHHVSGHTDGTKPNPSMLGRDESDRFARFELPRNKNAPGPHHAVVVDRVADDDEFEIEVTPVRVTSTGE